MGFIAPDHWTEVASQLKKSGQVKLDTNGNGVLIFDPDSANQRWVIGSIVVSTNQAATATVVPQCQLAMNTTSLSQLSAGNQRGSTWSGNQDTFAGPVDVGPCDFIALLFYPPPGSTGAQIALLSGVIASAVVSGTKFTRRG